MFKHIFISEEGAGSGKMSRKALLISNKYPFPADDGKKTVLAGFSAYLLDRYGIDNFIYVVIGKPDVKLDEMLSGRTVFIKPPGRLAQLWNLMVLFFRKDSQSMQEALTWSAVTDRALHTLLAEVKPELVILDTIRIGQYFYTHDEGSYRRILYMDDLFFVRFERLLKLADSRDGIELEPMGTFATHLPAFARALLRSKWLQKLLFKFEMTRVKSRETASPGHFDRCLLINPNEAATLSGITGASNVFSIKPLLFRDDGKLKRHYSGAPDFLIFGSLRHPVYRASVIRFLECCMDEISRIMPDARIRIVGAGADDVIIKITEKYPNNIELAGFVNDLDSLFLSSSALLVPMLAAGGLKLKALTALYYGLPMITTSSGIDGIDVQDNIDCILENRIERFPEKMKRLCDVHLNSEISHNARQTFLKYYSRDSIFTEYDRLFGSVD